MAESSSPSSDTLNPQEWHVLGPDSALFISDTKGDGGTETLFGISGKANDTEVLARVRLEPAVPGDSTELAVARLPGSKTTYVLRLDTDENGHEVVTAAHPVGRGEYRRIAVGDDTLAVYSQADPLSDAPTGIYLNSLTMGVRPDPELRVRQDGGLEETSSTANKVDRKVKAGHYRNKIRQRILLGLLAITSLRNGGVVDKAMDPFNDPEAAVIEVLDGTAEDSADSEQARVRGEAVDRIASVFGDLDKGNYENINSLGEQFVQDNKDELMQPDQVAEVYKKLESAETTEESMATLSEFLSFYNMSIAFSETDNYFQRAIPKEKQAGVNDDLKATGERVIRAISHLPANSFTPTLSGPTNIEIEVGLPNTPSEAAGSDGLILLPLRPKAGFRLLENPLADSLANFTGFPNFSFTRIFLHELRHTRDQGHLEGDAIDNRLRATIKFHIDNMLGRSPSATAYGLSHPLERQAENYADLMSPDTDFPDPDNVRRFNSSITDEQLEELLGMELRYPGFTAYLAMTKGVLGN